MEIKKAPDYTKNESQKIYLPIEEALCFIREHKNDYLFSINPTQSCGMDIVYEIEFTSQWA